MTLDDRSQKKIRKQNFQICEGLHRRSKYGQYKSFDRDESLPGKGKKLDRMATYINS